MPMPLQDCSSTPRPGGRSCGDYMVEIFRVLYLGRDEIKPSGTIRVNNCRNYQYLYNVPHINPSIRSIKPGDELPLTGPSIGAVCCGAGVRIEVDLFNGAYKTKICMDEWEPSYTDDKFNCIQARILSEDGEGEIVVLFGFYCNAAEARIEITMLDIDESVTEVYGIITAVTNHIKIPHISTCLFVGQSSSQGIIVQSPKLTPIPLSRPFVAVPLRSKLCVDVCLFSDEYMATEIFCDTLAFEAESDGTYQETRTFPKGKLQVKVTWDVNCMYRPESCISECWWNPGEDSGFEYSDSDDENPFEGMSVEDLLFYTYRALFADI